MTTTRTVAVIGDLHYTNGRLAGTRRGDIADILLSRAIEHLNTMVQPDAVLLVGDLLDDGNAPDAPTLRTRLRHILDGLAAPWLVIPGNHDGDPCEFAAAFGPFQPIRDLGGVRVAAFIDRDEPGCRASRPARHIDRLAKARANYAGPLVALQHVPVFPPGAVECPYNHVDAEALLRAMADANVMLSISGHYHPGLDPIHSGPTLLTTTPAFCEAPFPMHVHQLTGTDVTTTTVPLAMPSELALQDHHVHTQFGYCAQDAVMWRAIDIAQVLGLSAIGFAEHSGQLYFPERDYWSGSCHAKGLSGVRPELNRNQAYFDAAGIIRRDAVRVGLEVDVDLQGELVLLPEDRERADYLIGAVHRLQSLETPWLETKAVLEEFSFLTRQILAGDVDVLAHPFRMLRREGITLPTSLLTEVADLLALTGTAAEINVHMGGPPLEFIRLCLDRDVKLALAGDAHAMCDIGRFHPHLDLLRQAGVDDNRLDEVLYRF